jgi:hypothetical protein
MKKWKQNKTNTHSSSSSSAREFSFSPYSRAAKGIKNVKAKPRLSCVMRRKEKTESARVSPFDLSPCVCRRARMTWCRVYLSGSRAGICQQLHTHVYRIIPPIYFASSSSELNSWRMYLDIKRTHAGGRRLTGNRNCISIELRLEEMLLGLLHFPPVVWLFCWVMRSIRQRKIRDNNHNMDHWVWQGI